MGRASHRKPGPLCERPGLSQRDWASHRETRSHTERLGLSQEGFASHRKAGPLTEWHGLSHRVWESHREVGHLCNRPGFSHRGLASLIEAKLPNETQIQIKLINSRAVYSTKNLPFATKQHNKTVFKKASQNHLSSNAVPKFQRFQIAC